MKVRMKWEKETKGAVQYVEVDGSNNQLDMQNSEIGTLYVRKTSQIGQLQPKFITVEVDQEK